MLFNREVFRGLRSKTYKRIIIILLITFEATLMIFSGILFGLFRHISLNEVDSLNKQIVEKISSNTQYMNELVNKYSMLIFNDNVINPLLYNDGSGIDNVDEIRIINHLHNMSNAYGIIHSVIIYNGVADRFYAWDSNYYNDEFISKVSKDITSVKSPTLRVLPKDIYYHEQNVLTYVIGEDYGTGGFLVINVSSDWLDKNLSNADEKNGRLFIIDSDGYVVAQKKSKTAITSIPQTLMDGIKADEGNIRYTDENGRKVTAIYHHINDSDWTLVSINYYDDVYRTIRLMQLTAIVLTLIFGCCSIIIVLMTGKRIYSPVRLLVAKIESIFGSKKRDQDEMDYLYEILEHSSEMLQPDCRTVLREMLLGSTNYKLETFLELSENLHDAKKLVLVYILTVQNERIIESFKDIRCEMVKMHPESVIVIAADEKDFYDIEHICVSLTGLSGLSAITYSKPLNLTDNLSECYRKLGNIASYRLIYGEGRIITEEMISNNIKNDNVLIYSSDISKELEDMLTRGDMDEIYNVFYKFVEEISQNTVNNYLVALMKLVIELFSKETINRQERMGIYSQRLLTVSSNDTILSIFKDIFEELIPSYRRFADGQLASSPPSKADMIIDAVKMVIDNEYYCKSLSVSSIADEIKMSSGYLGKLFKQVEGISISDYIHRRRIEESVKLLSGTDYNIKSIMDLVGYDNESTFYSKFKKYMGVTPKEFRVMNSDSSGMIY